MYNEQLENLIEMALIDGELTEKEKQILFKKAEEFGIDLDEFEMVLEAKVFEIQKLQGQSTPPKEATISTQPNYEENKSSSIQRLLKSLDEYESKRMLEFGEEVERIKNKHNISDLADDDDEVSTLIEEAEAEVEAEIFEKKEEIIYDFLVSTDKDDMLEFLSVAVFQVQDKKNKESGLNNVWKDKCREVIENAKDMYATDLDVLSKIEAYKTELTPKIFRFFKKTK